ncbi:uncharacterized protein FPRO_03116 [Fusarium proliferatum ET1]|uniref:Uncharacterized protein n=1 Tax=Fusarium proliferatum (strain ET1) TaxID=1227346 RepID=A0A1L7V8X1_FUSPR|nr:uncharacterized protein FPRO_03116 [Fusarium proliferatum ET1]CZR36624.1 uncharacterized protein FPRO_03116 [Fusarium proliferatum ET1]
MALTMLGISALNHEHQSSMASQGIPLYHFAIFLFDYEYHCVCGLQVCYFGFIKSELSAVKNGSPSHGSMTFRFMISSGPLLASVRSGASLCSKYVPATQ